MDWCSLVIGLFVGFAVYDLIIRTTKTLLLFYIISRKLPELRDGEVYFVECCLGIDRNDEDGDDPPDSDDPFDEDEYTFLDRFQKNGLN